MDFDVMQGQMCTWTKATVFHSPVSKWAFKSWFESTAERAPRGHLMRFREAKLTWSIFPTVIDNTQVTHCSNTGTWGRTISHFRQLWNLKMCFQKTKKRNGISKMGYCVIFPYVCNTNKNQIFALCSNHFLSFSFRTIYADALYHHFNVSPPKIESTFSLKLFGYVL